MMIRIVSMTYVALCAALVFGLYHVKNETLQLEDQGRILDHKIEKASTDMQLLQAEWATRTSPDYLARLAADHLSDLRPTEPHQLASIASTPARAPEEPDSIGRLLSEYEQAPRATEVSAKLRPTL
jgi:hypothetical protein